MSRMVFHPAAPHPMTRARWISASIGFAILALAMLPPFVSEGARSVIMDAFAAVCHQLPQRSPHIAGIQLAACDRCMGIYQGLPLAALFFPLLAHVLRPMAARAPMVLVASVVPIGIDWGLDALGIVSNVPASRWVTGLIFGLVAGWYLTQAVADLVRRKGAPK